MSEPESITLEATRRRLSGKQADTVDKLTRSAVEVLAREGFAGMTIRMVAAPPHDRGPPPHNHIYNKEHLTERDLDAARRELNGEVVARKPDGTPWYHVREVRDAQNGLVN
uniref:polymorphic toxin type 28 domain-containing protein n=1 Tax=Nocardia brasiliensis TaxID=37326 RepID=UPI002455AA06